MISELLSEHNLHTEIYQGGITVKTLGRVMQFCTSYDDPLYSSFKKIPLRVSELLSGCILKFINGHNSIQCKWSYGT